MKLQVSRQYTWARVPNQCLRITALKLSETRGWSILCDDPGTAYTIYIIR